jgi:four helix bundle protein
MPQQKAAVLEHEKLSVYHKSLDLSSLVAVLTDSWPIGKHSLLDQLLRASTSVVLNIAEGAGEFSPREKARFYRMSRRSATECSAIMDVAVRHRAVTEDQRSTARAIILEVVAMLTALIRRLSPDADDTRAPQNPMIRTEAIGSPIVRPPSVRKDRPNFPEPFGHVSA